LWRSPERFLHNTFQQHAFRQRTQKELNMKERTKVLICAAAAAATIVGIAYATPIVNLASPLFSVGQHPSDIKTHGVGQTPGGQWVEVHLKSEGPSTMSTQDAAYSPGGHNGWHSHPGIVAVTLVSGSIQWFNEKCEETDYTAGDSWTEGSQLHYFRVAGAVGIHLTAFFITAQGAALRTDEPAPPCAAALGLT
jgi:quercetin dioxygenase-like cupin family protein